MNTITVHSISDFIKIRDSRMNVPARREDGEWFYLVNGQWVNQKLFDRVFPKVEYKRLNPKGDNPDKTKLD